MRRLTREACDNLAKPPMAGRCRVFNVSVATGICLFEAVRQRQLALAASPLECLRPFIHKRAFVLVSDLYDQQFCLMSCLGCSRPRKGISVNSLLPCRG